MGCDCSDKNCKHRKHYKKHCRKEVIKVKFIKPNKCNDLCYDPGYINCYPGTTYCQPYCNPCNTNYGCDPCNNYCDPCGKRRKCKKGCRKPCCNPCNQCPYPCPYPGSTIPVYYDSCCPTNNCYPNNCCPSNPCGYGCNNCASKPCISKKYFDASCGSSSSSSSSSSKSCKPCKKDKKKCHKCKLYVCICKKK